MRKKGRRQRPATFAMQHEYAYLSMTQEEYQNAQQVNWKEPYYWKDVDKYPNKKELTNLGCGGWNHKRYYYHPSSGAIYATKNGRWMVKYFTEKNTTDTRLIQNSFGERGQFYDAN